MSENSNARVIAIFAVIMIPPGCLILTIIGSAVASVWPRRLTDGKKSKLPIACQTGLGTMKASEREKVLKHLYRNRTSEYCVCHDNDSSGVKNCGDDDGCATDRTNETIECTDKKAIDLETGNAGEDIAANSSSDEEEAQSCGICLTPYEPRCQVTTATKSASCNHMFHSKCLMEWLQNNELCPYCRTPMMAPDELLEAATESLGKRRVAKLQREGLEEETN